MLKYTTKNKTFASEREIEDDFIQENFGHKHKKKKKKQRSPDSLLWDI